jgi:acetyl-CoA acetyltransferase
MGRLTKKVAVVGVGYSALSRGDAPDPRTLTLQSCRAAIADAGLEARDVDGVFEYLHRDGESPRTSWLQRVLGIENLNAYADLLFTGPSGLGPPLTAVTAVASGVCDVALAYRTLPQREGNNGGVVSTPEVLSGPDQFTGVYGHAAAILANYALKKRRRMHEFQTSAEDYGHVAISARRWAALNERAMLRTPLTMDDYLSSRVVVDPLLLLDCDYPVNGSAAVIVTTAERAADLPNRPVLVDAAAWGTGAGADFVFGDDFLYGGSIACAQSLWRGSQFTAADLDLMGLYDGFTHLPISWIEALGVCGPGEFGEWVQDGRMIGPGGQLPLNTSGGMLAEGRIQGIGLLAEVVMQLRGDCGARQVPEARSGVVAGGGSNDCGAMLLYTE